MPDNLRTDPEADRSEAEGGGVVIDAGERPAEYVDASGRTWRLHITAEHARRARAEFGVDLFDFLGASEADGLFNLQSRQPLWRRIWGALKPRRIVSLIKAAAEDPDVMIDIAFLIRANNLDCTIYDLCRETSGDYREALEEAVLQAAVNFSPRTHRPAVQEFVDRILIGQGEYANAVRENLQAVH